MDPHKMQIFNFLAGQYTIDFPENTRESVQSQSDAVHVAIDYGILCGSA
jgi:hypothetical protein